MSFHTDIEKIFDDAMKLAVYSDDHGIGLKPLFPFVAEGPARETSHANSMPPSKLASPPVPLWQRNLLVTLWLPLLLSLALLVVPVSTHAATVWSGPKVVFTKSDGADPKQAANQDRLTSNVWLTRGTSQGLYNIAREASFSHSFSPADTEWATGTTANYASLKYTDWDTWAGSLGKPPATVGVNAVLHLKTDDLYLDIKFLSWSERPSSGGGFSYERSTNVTAAPSSYLLSINMVGSGSVISNPAGINCGSSCSASFSSGSSVALTATPASGFTFTGWSGSCTGTGVCTMSMSSAKNVTATFAAPQGPTITFIAGWNLVGNSVEASITVTSMFSDAAKVTSVWKWIPSSAKWAFYSPAQTDGGAAFAASKGYEALTTINAGEGFWVNASNAFSASLPSGTAVTSSTFKPALSTPTTPGGTHALPSGWSLIATGDGLTPSQFDAAIATSLASPPTPGNVYTNLKTLWVWDAARQAWYFWAPALANSGGLASFVSSRNYLDSTTMPTTPTGSLSPITGFWVNMP